MASSCSSADSNGSRRLSTRSGRRGRCATASHMPYRMNVMHHYASQGHLNRVAGLRRSSRSVAVEKEHADAITLNKFHCNVCEKSSTTSGNLGVHFKTLTHQEKAVAAPDLQPPPPPRGPPPPKDPIRARRAANYARRPAEAVEDDTYHCFLCDVSCGRSRPFTRHLDTVTHARNVRAAEKAGVARQSRLITCDKLSWYVVWW